MIWNLSKQEKAVSFEADGGLKLELTYHADGAWRLRADGCLGASFTRMGDAQSLAAYLGEEVKDTARPFEGYETNGAFVLTTEDGESERDSEREGVADEQNAD